LWFFAIGFPVIKCLLTCLCYVDCETLIVNRKTPMEHEASEANTQKLELLDPLTGGADFYVVGDLIELGSAHFLSRYAEPKTNQLKAW